MPGLIWRLRRLMAEHDVVFANTQKAFVIAAFAARLAGKPCIWELQDIVGKEHFSSFSRRLGIALANRLAARVIANSNASATEFIAAGGDPGKVAVVPLGIDPMVFAPGGASGDAIRRELGIRDAPVVGCFSRLSPWKGQHVLIEALARVPDIHALIVGKELFGEEDYRISLHRRVRELGMEHRIHFLGFTNRMPEMLSAVDFVVHAPTAPEPFGRVMVEAMLAAKPIVATGTGAGREIIEDGVSGLLVPPGDPDRLAGALRQLMADPALASSLAAQGRRRAESRFSLQAMLDSVNRELAPFAPARRVVS
jgi:glycosyltransferase involved in cell wall biosynthesis